MNLDLYRVTGDAPVSLGLAKPAFFMVAASDRAVFNPKRVHRTIFGFCKRATIEKEDDIMSFTLPGADESEFSRMERRLEYLCSTNDSLGLVIERVAGKTALVAMFVTEAARNDAEAVFAEMDEEGDA